MATEPHILTSDLFLMLDQVRRSALRLAIVFAVASTVAYPLAPSLLHWLARPLGTPLIMYAPLEGLMGYITVSMTASCCLTAPLVLYEGYRLLKKVSRLPARLAFWSMVAAAGLFLAGAAFCYGVILPVTLRFLLGFGGENITAGISVSRYLSMTLGLSAACGLTFELPLVTLILHRLGLLSVAFLAEHRRYAVLLGAVVTAIITPTPDAFTMSALFLPLLGLYEISILLMRLAERRRARRA
ncbi:MAG: twin-arginine translocase subunit TatC [Candidatus Tectimicrobiota bacterium]